MDKIDYFIIFLQMNCCNEYIKFQNLATVVRVAVKFTGLLKIKKRVFMFDLSCVEIK